MSKLILIILLLGGILFWWHWNNTPEPKQQKLLLQKTVVGILVVVMLLLVVTGRMHWLGAVFAGALATFRQMLPLLLRYMPMFTQAYSHFGPKGKPPNASTVSSKIVEMTLDHMTGKLSGKVLDGSFKGHELDELSHKDLQDIYQYCVQADMNSAKLLESYLQERFGEQYIHKSETNDDKPNRTYDEMNISEALQVLGLEEDPDPDEIINAYRKLIQKLHPDRGGNEYFAAKANQAREVLLKKYG
jgi:hypothetical protein